MRRARYVIHVGGIKDVDKPANHEHILDRALQGGAMLDNSFKAVSVPPIKAVHVSPP
jgi:hypothetical protein